MKSQRKLGPDDRTKLKEKIAKFFKAWRDGFPSKEVFVKLEHLTHEKEFIDRWHMLGRVSEESFEAVHPKMGKMMNRLKAMPSGAKVQTLSRQFSSGINANIRKAAKKIETKSKERGKYAEKPRTTQSNENTNVSKPDYQISDGVARLPCGNGSIKEDWLEVAKYVVYSEVPKSWFDCFAEEEMGTSLKLKPEYA
jgi:hypothetical protein